MSKEVMLSEVMYGISPSGYKEEMNAEHLHVGQIYQIGAYRFRLTDKGNKLTHELGSFDQIRAV
jgi:hypothetical protein